MKVHHASIIRATESDNEEWAWLTCGHDDYKRPKYTGKWPDVNCKNCLRRKPRKGPKPGEEKR